MTDLSRIQEIARQAIEQGVPPADTEAFRSDPGFGRKYSHDIWCAIAGMRAAGRKGRRDRDEEEPDQEPEIASEPEDDAEDADDADEDEDDSDDSADDADDAESECLCSCRSCVAGNCSRCAYSDDAECESPNCGCRDEKDDEDDDEEEDD